MSCIEEAQVGGDAADAEFAQAPDPCAGWSLSGVGAQAVTFSSSES